MSYVSGFMMGAAIGKSIHRFLMGDSAAPAQAHRAPRARQAQQAPLSLVLSVPGRRRYRAAYMTQAQADLLTAQLQRLSFIECVQANPVTGSILLTYDPAAERRAEALGKWLCLVFFAPKAACAQQKAQNMDAEWSETPREAAAGALSRSIVDTCQRASAWLKERTNGALDMNVAFALWFAIRGLRKIILYHDYPRGPQLFWWAFALMRGWRK